MDKLLVCRECGEPVSQERDGLCGLCEGTLVTIQEHGVDTLTLHRRYRDGYEG